MTIQTKIEDFSLRKAEKEDIPVVLDFIRKLAEYENLSHEVTATEEKLERYLFGNEKVAEVVMGYYHNVPVGFALYFFNFSTFLAKPGIYLEDLFITKEYRGKGFGKIFLSYLAKLAIETECGRVEWAVLDWNTPSIEFYKSLGARVLSEWLVNRMAGDKLVELANQF